MPSSSILDVGPNTVVRRRVNADKRFKNDDPNITSRVISSQLLKCQTESYIVLKILFDDERIRVYQYTGVRGEVRVALSAYLSV